MDRRLELFKERLFDLEDVFPVIEKVHAKAQDAESAEERDEENVTVSLTIAETYNLLNICSFVVSNKDIMRGLVSDAIKSALLAAPVAEKKEEKKKEENQPCKNDRAIAEMCGSGLGCACTGWTPYKSQAVAERGEE